MSPDIVAAPSGSSFKHRLRAAPKASRSMVMATAPRKEHSHRPITFVSEK